MSRFLIDENLSPQLAAYLRSLGHDAVAVRDVGLRGQGDATLVKWVKEQRRIIITRDWDFGEVIFWKEEGRIGVLMIQSASQQMRAHVAVLHALHQQGVLHDRRLGSALLVATPTDHRWWDSRSLQ